MTFSIEDSRITHMGLIKELLVAKAKDRDFPPVSIKDVEKAVDLVGLPPLSFWQKSVIWVLLYFDIIQPLLLIVLSVAGASLYIVNISGGATASIITGAVLVGAPYLWRVISDVITLQFHKLAFDVAWLGFLVYVITWSVKFGVEALAGALEQHVEYVVAGLAFFEVMRQYWTLRWAQISRRLTDPTSELE